MKASLNFIKDFVKIDETNEELYKLLSFKVIEVEEYYKLIDATNLTIGHINECVMHPDSDHLHICQIDLGDKVEQIVCGAPNCTAGINVVVAKDGAVLPGNFKIKKSKVRGVESNGMCCSLQELGIEEKYVPEEFKNGIVILGDDAKAGEDPLKYLGLDDTVFELGLTPNRGDLLSHLGVAYDIAAAKGETVSFTAPVMKNAKPSDLSVKVETENCYAYYARKITNITIKESPWWLKGRLIACGIRPINNLVDITNYVMLELGTPLHAFDADIIGNNIVVRNAKEGEKTTTLDEVERELKPTDVVITDGKEVIAIGGVMGCLKSGINENTKNIILESAYFAPTAIRKTASRLNLHSEASMRYERIVDPSRTTLALDRATELFGLLADGNIDNGYACVDNLKKDDKEISIELNKIKSYLGIDINEAQVEEIFKRLGFKVEANNGSFKVFVPSRRVDISTSQDLQEEIARMYGYGNIPSTLPNTNSKGALNEKQKLIRSVRHFLAGLGLMEVVNYSLINKNDLNKFGEFTNEISLLMPMTSDRETLRQTLLNSIVEDLRYNSARQQQDLAIFEIGKGYNTNGEYDLLAAGIKGMFNSSLWQGKKTQSDFYLLKGILEQLLAYVGIEVTFVKGVNNGLHNGQTAFIMAGDTKLGVIGGLHPLILKENDINEGFVFEINLDEILKLRNAKNNYKPISKFPTVSRDIAILINKDVPASDIIALIKQTAKKLVNINIFDVYQGDKIDANLKSIAISLEFQDTEKTLTSEDVDKFINQILKRLDFTYQAKLRS
ncbi:MAG: phenylalanine--tRNA ligase subunit beta [Acholeplasmatales bacterium]|nr:phenylalanine--tRNA ligase subunit beta [Acholeplasmatales bacterium]